MAQAWSRCSECSLIAQRSRTLSIVVRSVRSCPIRYAFALAVACGGAAGCKASRSPIFEWAPPTPVAGASGSGSGSGIAGASGAGDAAVSGRPAPEIAGRAGDGIRGESGTSPQVDQSARFEWTQKLPGMCSGANYVGSVSCNVQNGIPGTRIDGTLVLDLVGPSESQELDVGKGTLNLLVDPTNMVSLMTAVTGTASCMDKSLTGEVPETMFTGDQVGLPFQLLLGVFCGAGTTATSIKGTLVGVLDPRGSLFGDLALMIGTCICEGPFELRQQR
jgi:hypothetical protein